MRRFHGMDGCKRDLEKEGKCHQTSTCTPSTSSTNVPEKEVLAGNVQQWGTDGKKKRRLIVINIKQWEEKQEKNQMGLTEMDVG
ncbi:hypothetical protein Tco_0568282 [Tanacetum coccineum]